MNGLEKRLENLSRRLFVVIAFVLTSSHVFAIDPNGCGSGWNTFVVPDRIKLLGCEFKSSCDLHDKCYSICESSLEGICEYRRCRTGGDLFGQDICREDRRLRDLIKAAQTRKDSCDVKLGDDIRNGNPNNWGCKAVGVLYRYAVKEWGDGNFAGYGSKSQPLAWKQPQEVYNKALTDFLEQASQDDLKAFVESADLSTPLVNLCGRLRYSRDGGLENLTPEDRYACRSSAR